MFRLCKVETSVNNLRHNDITKNQSERLKNYRSLSPSGTIFNMAASEEDVVGRDVKVHEYNGRIAIRNTSAVLYDKPLKTTK